MISVGVILIVVAVVVTAVIREKQLGRDSDRGWTVTAGATVFIGALVLVGILGSAYEKGGPSYTTSINGDQFYCERSTTVEDIGLAWPGATVEKYDYTPGSETCWPLTGKEN